MAGAQATRRLHQPYADIALGLRTAGRRLLDGSSLQAATRRLDAKGRSHNGGGRGYRGGHRNHGRHTGLEGVNQIFDAPDSPDDRSRTRRRSALYSRAGHPSRLFSHLKDCGRRNDERRTDRKGQPVDSHCPSPALHRRASPEPRLWWQSNQRGPAGAGGTAFLRISCYPPICRGLQALAASRPRFRVRFDPAHNPKSGDCALIDPSRLVDARCAQRRRGRGG
jgi:hypothetical protein